MKPNSETIYHFLARNSRSNPEEQFQIFKNIFEKGLLFSEITITVEQASIYNRCICFTDIPLTMMDEHVRSYGKFAIGFKKEFVKNNGGNPVFYFVDHNELRLPEKKYSLRGVINSNLIEIMNFVGNDFRILMENGEEYDSVPLKDYMIQFLSHCKEIGDLGPPSDGSERVDSYFIEREWRIVEYKLHEQTDKLKIIGDKRYLKFRLDHVRTIVVPNKDVSRMVMNYLQSQEKNNMPIIIEYDEIKYL